MDLPRIKLDGDYTIADLYRQAGPRTANKHIVQVVCGLGVPVAQLTDANHEMQRSLDT
jgi:hypothetical protein